MKIFNLFCFQKSYETYLVRLKASLSVTLGNLLNLIFQIFKLLKLGTAIVVLCSMEIKSSSKIHFESPIKQKIRA